MNKRIDFNRYQKEDPTPVVNSVIPEDMQMLYSDAKALQPVVDQVSKENTVFWKSEGDWSMHQMLLALLTLTGPADVFISSYAMGETPARVLFKLWDERIVKTINCVLDNRVEVRTAGSLQLMRTMCCGLALIDTHAKVTVLRNDAWDLVVVGSANYTENKRVEAGVICNNAELANMHIKWIMKAISNGNNT